MAGEPDEVTGLRRLYVCLTRAVTSLVIVHPQPLPAALLRASEPERCDEPQLARKSSTAAFHSAAWLTVTPCGPVLDHHQSWRR